jgi:diguanylate cyclase (GGDEF)-like protein
MDTPFDVQGNALRRTLLASCGVFLYSVLIIICYSFGYIVIDKEQLVILMTTFWLGHIAAVVFVYLRYRKSKLAPSMTLPHMAWAILYISIIMYHTVEIRPALMMSYLTILPFGAFRFKLRGFFGITLFTLSCYAVALFLLQQHRPGHWIPEVEAIIGVSFLLGMLGYSVIGHEFSLMRDRFYNTKKQLDNALAKIDELAITDELTGLYSRRHLLKVLEQQRAVCHREDTSFVLASIDLDDFKLIVEQYGYDVGDEILCQFSELLKDSIREVDAVARYGNEEFVLLLNSVGIETALIVVERIRQTVEVYLFSKLDLNVTISVGITQYHAPESVADTLARTAELLSDAKREGCNRVVQGEAKVAA